MPRQALLLVVLLHVGLGALADQACGSDAIPANIDPATVINMLIQSGYVEDAVYPAGRCDDATFVRRVHLDLVGRIPSSAETERFLGETNSQKRELLIECLLQSDEFAEHMAISFDVTLMGRKESKLASRRQHGWHRYLRTVFRENRPWDQVAREVLLARPTPEQRGHLWFLFEREDKHQEIAEAVAKAFFGVDIACAQCHDHPSVDEIQQQHYWGLVAFFNRSKNQETADGMVVGESAIGGFGSYANALTGESEEVSLTFLHRETVHESRPEKPAEQEDKDEFYVEVPGELRRPKFSRREQFVDHILQDHPMLARAMVNRVWAQMMGRGIVHPVDEMDSQHPASHPELLDWLARDFKDHNYDVKRLVHSIVRSRPYQLDASRPEGASVPSTFAFAIEKPLSAEAYLRSISTVLEEPIPDSIQAAFRQLFPEIVHENQLSNLKQTMALSNHPALQEWLDVAAAKIANDFDGDRLDDLFFRAFGRSPTDEERERIDDYFAAHEKDTPAAISSILWAFVTSAEFRFNH